MKKNEEEILNRLNQYNLNLIWDDYQYNRFDAESNKLIVEIKDRHTFYKETMIEFEKFSYNLLYSILVKKMFIYAVRMDGYIYLFNINRLFNNSHNFKWEWKLIEATTNFERRELVKKFVGYIDINIGDKINA
tara:strand:- start:3246 stop:3644 length:399 start_codon:yes stop_codon:yes gene_type:complete